MRDPRCGEGGGSVGRVRVVGVLGEFGAGDLWDCDEQEGGRNGGRGYARV